MLIGIDFDNTIVCYDALFHRVCRERGLIPAEVPINKTDVRNYLRQAGREDAWTEMQGYVYGARMSEAAPYPGVLDFFRSCRAAALPDHQPQNPPAISGRTLRSARRRHRLARTARLL